MNSLLIVGHPHSNYQVIEEILQQHGMAQAKVSRTQLLSPTEINNKLLTAGKTKITLGQSKIRQIKPAALWKQLALDLLLANVDQDFWGWSDTQSIFLVDFWKAVEPRTKFILVYSSPEEAIASIFKDKAISEKEFTLATTLWQSYNNELASFYLNNKEQCLLVHSEEVSKNTSVFIKSLSGFLNKRLKSKTKSKSVTSLSQINDANLILAKGLIEGLPNIQQAYQELQSIADIQLNIKIDDMADSISIWNNNLDMKNQDLLKGEQQLQKVHQLEEENSLLTLNLHQVQEELEQFYFSTDETKKNHQQEEEIYILQLQQLQDELNYIYIENNKLIQDKPNDPDAFYGAADRVRNQLSYRLGATMLKQSNSVIGWFGMPWALISESSKFSKEKPKRDASKLPPISQYQDAAEADKMRQHLSYRLGKAMIDNTNSTAGWFKLPWAISREISDFNKKGNGRKKESQGSVKK